jgi:hypothetical protein
LATAQVERRLAAVLAADIAGYSRLMGIDEEGTLARPTSSIAIDRVRVFTHLGPKRTSALDPARQLLDADKKEPFEAVLSRRDRFADEVTE